jgi:hypothetical protein
MRYLLYIDILGFSDLVQRSSEAVQDLYEVIVSLNAHRHDAFKTIIFSDTILIYSRSGTDDTATKSYLIMFLCEFAQDLQDRLTGRNVVFRAVLVRGAFRHYELNSVPCFFGQALIEAYRAEKEIKAIGLFIHKSIENDCDVFDTRAYNDNFSFVYITQSIGQIERFHGKLPLDRFELEQTDLIWRLTPEVLYLHQIYVQMQNHPNETVREKYANTWKLLRIQYPNTTEQLVAVNFNLDSVCPGASWKEVLARYPEDCSYAITSREEY